MPLNDAALNGMAGWLADHATHLSLHADDPGGSGANETTAPRVPANWPAPVSGDLLVSNKDFTNGVPNDPAQYVGLWSAATGGTFYGGFLLSGDTTFNANGDYTVTSLTINGASS